MIASQWRILMLTFNLVGKGTYWRAFHFARHLARRGHQVTLMAMARQNRLRFHIHEVDGVTIVETPDLLGGALRSGWDIWDSLRRIFWLRGHEFDLIHAFEARPVVLLPMLYLQFTQDIPLIMDWCDWFGRGGSVEERHNPIIRTFLRPVETFFEERFRTRANGTTVICSTLRDKAMQLGIPQKKILLVYDGADVEGLQPLDQQTCRQALELPIDVPIIGYVGAIFYRDAWLMAQAFDQLHALKPDVRLLLIGYVNFPIEEMVKAKAAVIRTGLVNHADLNRYLAACTVCWLPYCDSGANRGRWPLKLNDYMAVGRPTVATAVGDVPQVMQTYDIGLLTQPVPEDIAFKVLTLLSDPESCVRIGANARRVAKEVFDWRLQTTTLEAFYERILSEA